MSGRWRFVLGGLVFLPYPTLLRSRIRHMHMCIAIIPMTRVRVTGLRVERHCMSWLVTESGRAGKEAGAKELL